MTQSFFPQDSYTTPPGSERLLSKILLRSRIYYLMRFLYIVFRYWPLARSNRFDFDTWQQTALRVLKIVEDSGGRLHISGLNNIRRTEGPVVFVANHMSTVETLILPPMIYPFKLPVFVIKEQLRKTPFFGAYVRACITVGRKNPAEDFKQVMTQGTAKISKGISVIIFPQARRSVSLDPAQFNSLGIKLARRTRVPVIPIAIKTDFWGSGRILKDFGPLDLSKKIYFEFGEPVRVKGSGKEEHEQIITFITRRLESWNKQG